MKPMRTHSSRIIAATVVSAAALVALAAGASPAAAQKAAAATAAAAPTYKQAVTQVDGITSRVIDKLWVQTDAYWHDGDYNRIVGLIRVVVEAEPTFSEAYANGAYLLWSMGDTASADWFLQRGIRNTPKDWSLPFEFGRHLFTTKRYASALPYLKKATTYKTATALPYSMLAHTYDRLGRLEESVTTWRQVVKKFPTFVSGPTNLARVQAKLRQKNQGSNR